jgi:hypothetical protein
MVLSNGVQGTVRRGAFQPACCRVGRIAVMAYALLHYARQSAVASLLPLGNSRWAAFQTIMQQRVPGRRGLM